MTNRGNMLQSSAGQQLLGGGPNTWWRIMPTPPPPSQPHFSAASSQPHFFPDRLPPPSHHTQQLPDSLIELLMSGSVCEEDNVNSDLKHKQQVKKLEKWEEQLLQDHHSQLKSSNVVNVVLESAVKQENSLKYSGLSSYGVFHSNNWSNNPVIPISSPNSCVSSLSNNMLDFSTTISKNTNGRHPPLDRLSEVEIMKCISSASTTCGGASKKAKIFKVRNEKLGDRITALHQIVSPFGKTDTASVLLEAIGYIRFLHTQIQALSLPYLQNNRSPNMSNHQHSDCYDKKNKDLRSRGLCVVPVSCTLQVGSENGADYWAPALNGGFP